MKVPGSQPRRKQHPSIPRTDQIVPLDAQPQIDSQLKRIPAIPLVEKLVEET